MRASAENADGGESKENLIDLQSGTKWLAFESTAWIEFDLDAPVKVGYLRADFGERPAGTRPERLDAAGLRRRQELEGSRRPEGRDVRGALPDEVVRHSDARRLPALPAGHHQEQRLQRYHPTGRRPVLQRRRHDSGTAGHAHPGRPRTRGFPHRQDQRRLHRHPGAQVRRYRTTVDGRAYSYNKVFDVNVAVRRNTALSYRIYPSMPETDLNYPATNVSVDLAFTDGTYLSDLKALDSHGGLLTPQGQGAAKRLYVNQWNQVDSTDRLGRRRQDRRPDPGGVRLPEGPGEVPGLDRRHHAWPRRPRRSGSRICRTTRPPIRGTNSSGSFSRGNNFPATAVPNGFNFWTPVTDAASTSWLYEYARGQQRGQPAHPAGVQRQPRAEPLDGRPADLPGDAVRGRGRSRPPTAQARALPFRHENETAKPALLRGDVRERSRRPR